jgi:hypothetical protein
MPDHEFSELILIADRKFPDGCLCEDSGECAYCGFVMNYLTQRRLCRAVSTSELSKGLGICDLPFNIPIGETAQIYELRRVFRL